MGATDKILPAPTGRNGCHYQSQALSGVMLTYLQQLSAELASRKVNRGVLTTLLEAKLKAFVHV